MLLLVTLVQLAQAAFGEKLLADQFANEISYFLLTDVCLFLEQAPSFSRLYKFLENFAHLQVVLQFSFFLCLAESSIQFFNQLVTHSHIYTQKLLQHFHWALLSENFGKSFRVRHYLECLRRRVLPFLSEFIINQELF